jgi:hypothetical protein
MSEFKFACPVCGQHITCDSGSSGTQMDCPTCFRKLVVPPAPAPGSSQFVLTAAAAQTRKIPLPGNITTPAVAPARKIPVLAIGLGMLAVGLVAAAGIIIIAKKGRTGSGNGGGEGLAANRGATNAPPVFVLPPPAPDATNWTLNLAAVKIPDLPASGAVHGLGFKLDRAVIQGGRLDLRQGAKWPPDVGLSIHLFAERAQDLAGKTVVLESVRTNAPRVILRWKEGPDQAATKEFRQGYAARVEFGKVTGNRLEGKIFLATPDPLRSYVAGTFSAEIRKPASPK